MGQGSEWVSLAFGGCEIRIFWSDFDLIANRESIEVFAQADDSVVAASEFTLVRSVEPSLEWARFGADSGATGAYRCIDSGIAVHPETNSIGLSLALRGLFSRAIERQGGVLVHAAGVSWDGRAALITGVSGAGKSTLARWCAVAGATLLSDEVVGVLPDGTLLGTPFRSDPDLQGTPTESRLHLVTTLHHGAFEAFDERPAYELIAALCEQAFHREAQISAGQVLKCVAQALKGVDTTRFTCRNAASAGEALRVRLLGDGPVGNA